MSVAHAHSHPEIPRNYAKWALFAVMGLLTLGVLWTDERFLVDSTDSEWAHIETYKWWLLVHGVAGATALFIGPFQFSERLRRQNVKLHRLLGKIYIGAILIAAPVAIYIGYFSGDSHASSVENWGQAGGWLLCAVLAYVFAVKRNIPRHKQWVARSYGFTFVFIMARGLHLVGFHFPDEGDFVTYRWFLVFGALIVPDLILQWDELFRRKPARAVRAGG
ncbi:MAG TPA: DUF2306 domain-containing protein [Alphaproteobacteria bacterium]|jgi:uncharacterized membrane protein|nr:DUF2306 domain-containing protein [Alphaproteobacteria bacterium]